MPPGCRLFFMPAAIRVSGKSGSSFIERSRPGSLRGLPEFVRHDAPTAWSNFAPKAQQLAAQRPALSRFSGANAGITLRFSGWC